jgi:hypothetical protein
LSEAEELSAVKKYRISGVGQMGKTVMRQALVCEIAEFLTDFQHNLQEK